MSSSLTAGMDVIWCHMGIGSQMMDVKSLRYSSLRWRLRQWWRRTFVWKAWYWVRCHLFTRYHVVDVGYRGGWIDRTELLLQASFKILVDFVEKERPDLTIDWFSDEFHAKAWDEISTLYLWWKCGRGEEHDELSRLADSLDREIFEESEPRDDPKWGKVYDWVPSKDPRWDEYCRLTDELEKKDQDMLERLVRVRGFLWT